MNISVENLSNTIVPKSDQLNADDVIAGPMTITVKGVAGGTSEQPVIVRFEGDEGRPYKPCKSMRRLLIAAWGVNGHDWVGRSMTLYNDPNVRFGGVATGGIRISHLSHIDRDMQVALTVTKGKREQYPVKVLRQAKRAEPAAPPKPADDLALDDAPAPDPDSIEYAMGIDNIGASASAKIADYAARIDAAPDAAAALAITDDPNYQKLIAWLDGRNASATKDALIAKIAAKTEAGQ